MSLVLEGTLGDPPRTYGVRDGLLVCGTCEVAAAAADPPAPSPGHADDDAFAAHACPVDAPPVLLSLSAAGDGEGGLQLSGLTPTGETGETGSGEGEAGDPAAAGETGETGDTTPTRTTRRRASTT